MRINNYLRKIKQLTGTALLFLSFSAIAQPPPPGSYCEPTYTNASCAPGSQDYVQDFSTTGGITNISNLGSGCANPGGAPNYYYYAGNVLTILPGTTFGIDITNTPDFAEGYRIWVDWNQDGTFDVNTEEVYNSGVTIPAGGTATGICNVPIDALPGLTRMRVRCVFNTMNFDPCSNYTYGEVEDYDVQVNPLQNCNGTPVAGTALANVTNACPTELITLSLDGFDFGTGTTLQWQGSFDNISYTDIPGATSSIYTTTQNASTYYRCVVTCTGLSANSQSVYVIVNDFYACYCNTNLGGGCNNGGITDFEILNTTLLNNNTLCDNLTATNYSVYPISGNTTADLQQEATYVFNVTTNDNTITSIWIDYDHSGTFDDTEWTQVSVTSTAGAPSTISITIPPTSLTGLTGMRVRSRLNGNINGATDACLNMGSGSTQDYVINITPGVPCTAPPVAGITVSNTTSICGGSSFNLSLNGSAIGIGLTYQWQISTDGINYVDIAGATANTLTTSQTQTNYYRCSLTCSGQVSYSDGVMVENLECYFMDGNPVTTCSGIFYDNGGLLNYTNNASFVQTFTPATPGQMLQFDFVNFECEGGFDSLKVYNGNSTASPLLGAFSGATLPGIVVASNLTGELTFEFFSDGSVTLAGWEANISCVAPVTNDAATLYAYTYGKLPIGFGTPHQVTAYVKNNNSTLPLTFPVTLTISGANTFSDTQTITLGAQEIGMVTFAGYTPTATGMQTLTIAVASDQNATNDLITIDQEVSPNAYSYKFPSVQNQPFGLGFNGVTGDFVSKFNTLIPGSLNSVKVDFTVAGATYQIGVWDATGLNGTPGALLYTSSNFTTNIGTDYITINPPIALTGEFYVGVRQTSGTNVQFAYQTEDPLRAGTFYYTSPTGTSTWADVKDIPSTFRFAMEIEMAIPAPPNCAVYNSPIDAATDVCLNQGILNWASGGLAPTSYDVYFGTDPTLASVTPVNVTNTNYDPGFLLPNTTYYWKIVPVNIYGPATGCAISSFTTGTCVTYLMSDNSVTTCSGNFFDSGDIGANYQNNESYVMTFTPSTPGAFMQVDFTSFATEAGFDFLKIYNGGSVASPVIGPAGGYDGANSPGTVVASNPSGQLTFEFTSDGSVQAAGWEAIISCITTPPVCANITSPANLAADICINAGTINWDATGASAGYIVSFGTDPALVGATVDTVTTTQYYPGTLLANTTYYYQVIPYNTFGNATGCGIQSFSVIDCNSCNFSIVMTDAFGDGWNGGNVQVFSQGVEVAGSPFTLATGAGPLTISFPVNEGDSITTLFNAGGFPGEVQYQILNSFGQVEFADGFAAQASAGPNFAGVASCLPVTNDAQVQIVYTLGKLPIGYGTPHTIYARVINNNTFDSSTIPVTLDITGANTFSNTQSVTLNAGESAIVAFPGFNPTVIGTNNMVVSVPSDQDNSNNSQTIEQTTTANVYTYKLPAVANEAVGVGFAGATGDFVAKFNSNGANPINQVNVDFIVGGQTYDLGIWDATGPGGTPGTLISQVTGLTSVAGTAFVTVNPPVIVNGDFFVGVRQTGTTNIQFAFQNEDPIRPQTFYYTTPTGSVTWTDFDPGSPFRFAIEVEIALPVPPNCATYVAPLDADTGLCTNQVNLQWASGGLAPTSYDVYLSTDPTFTAVTPVNVTGLTYNPGILNANTQYYWKVVPLNVNGAATGCISQTFTTGDCNYFLQSTDTITTCGGTYYDAGGPAGNYANNENSSLTFVPSAPNSAMQVTFNSFDVENNFDFLRVYDGYSAAAPLIGTFTGATAPTTLTAGTLVQGNIALTFVFTSDGSVTPTGWDATLGCIDTTAAPGCVVNTLPADGSTNVNVNPTISWTAGPGTIPTSYDVYFGTQGNLTLVSDNQTGTTFSPTSTLALNTVYCYQIVANNANGSAVGCSTTCFTTDTILVIQMSNSIDTVCTAIFTDSQGLNANYNSNENFTHTFYPATANSAMQITFTDFNTENLYDGLLVYDGPDATFPLIPSGDPAGNNAATCPADSWRGTTGDATADPGVFTSTHPTGALTFVFTSDGSVTRPGWRAVTSCLDLSTPPGCVINTTPADAATNVSVNPTITWSAGPGTVPTSYDVYFGTQGNLTLVSDNQPTTSFTPTAQLALNTTYCYQIVSNNANGSASGCNTYCFTTDTVVVYQIDQADSIVTCDGVWTDAGGPNGNYSSNELYTQTLVPSTPNSAMQVTFTEFDTEAGFDDITVYDAPTADPLFLIGTFDGTTIPGPFTAGALNPGNRRLTFVFSSDGSVTRAGWRANLSCVPLSGCLSPVITVTGNTTNCVGSSVTLTSSNLDNNEWSNGQTGNSITIVLTADQTITVTDTVCALTSAPIDLVAVSIPQPAIQSNNGNTICAGGTLDLTVSTGPIPPPPGTFTYLWSTGAVTPTISVTAPGCYTCIISNSIGCSVTSSEFCVTSVPNPIVTASGNTTFCQGEGVILTAPAGADSYSWSNGTGNAGNTQSITVTTAGNYTVTTTSGTCVLTSAPTSVVVNTIVIPTISSTATSVCTGSSVTLTSSQDANYVSYSWNGSNPSGNILQVTQAGNYTVTVVSNNGCSATSASISITEGSAFQPGITVGGNTIICEGQSVVMLSNSVTGNQWYRDGVLIAGATQSSYSATATGLYSVTVTTANGCAGSSVNIPVVVNPLPSANGLASADNNGLVVFTNNSTNYFASQWNFGDGTAFSNQTNPTHLYNSNGSYVVSLTVYNDCGSNTMTMNVEVTQTGIKTLSIGQSLNISPNPTKGQLLVDFNDATTKSLNVNLVNLAGQVIYTESVNNFNGKFKQNINLDGFASGVYFVQMITDSNVITRKIVKE